MARFVLDTHALVWFLAGSPHLGRRSSNALSDPQSEPILPAIALAEALWIVSSRQLGLTQGEMLTALDADHRLVVHPLTREIVEISSSLSTVGEMHDRLIVGTTLELARDGSPPTLLTKDENITTCGLVPVEW